MTVTVTRRQANLLWELLTDKAIQSTDKEWDELIRLRDKFAYPTSEPIKTLMARAAQSDSGSLKDR